MRGNSVVTVEVDLVPHEEEYGSFSPKREIIAPLQGVPKNITCGDQGTVHE